jgi:hypothetical protein
MVGNRNRYCRIAFLKLHDDMTSALTNLLESLRCKNLACIATG